jgi:hypothetical protein
LENTITPLPKKTIILIEDDGDKEDDEELAFIKAEMEAERIRLEERNIKCKLFVYSVFNQTLCFIVFKC